MSNLSRTQSQNQKILDYLKNGGKLTSLQVRQMFQSCYLNSRISDIRNKMGIPVSDVWVDVQDANNEPVRVKQYFLDTETLQKLRA
jgi:hypothetical protein